MTMYRQMREVVEPAPAVATGGRSVFVDERGVRARRLAWGGRICAIGFALYLAAMVASLVGAPWVPKAGLPGVSSALPVRTSPRVTLPPSALRLPSPVPASTKGTSGTSATTPAPRKANTPAQAGSTTTTPATTTTTRPGNHPTPTTVPPGNSGTAPGHGKKP